MTALRSAVEAANEQKQAALRSTEDVRTMLE
jgi:hypothetical protein